MLSEIEKRCLSEKGRLLKSRLLKEDIEWLTSQTPFLPDDVEMEYRFYSIKLGKSEKDFVCLCCGNAVKMKWVGVKQSFRQYCSKTCMTLSTRSKATKSFSKTYKEKNIYEKVQATITKNYGSFENMIRERSVQTDNTRRSKYNGNYNSDTQLQSTKDTSNPNKIEGWKQSLNTKLGKYGKMSVTNPLKISKAKKQKHYELMNFSNIEFIEDENVLRSLYNTQGYDGIMNFFSIKNKHYVSKILDKFQIRPFNELRSETEKNIQLWLESLGVLCESNNRKILNGKEIDIFVPSKSLGIELNGVYWHSVSNNSVAEKHRHLQKTINANDKGIDLLQFWDSEWNDKKEICKSIIKSKLNIYDRIIYGRKTKLKVVSNQAKKCFLDNNHLQGDCQSSINLGLYHNDELVFLATFGKSRFIRSNNNEHELLRMCSLTGHKIIGGFSKILKHFKSNYMMHDDKLISYVDRRISSGKSYKSIGFEQVSETSPSYSYTKGNIIKYSRYQAQKHKLNKILNIFDNNLTEFDNMILNGYKILYDCGTLKFEL